ncbi:MAG: TlpA family protein disulfide reductase [Betaproteobacteria bacterium]
MSLPDKSETKSVQPPAAPPPSGFVFRIHDAPRALPELAFEDGEGRKRALSEFRGKVVLVNVWATWCAPCREEMPSLDRLQQKLGGRDFEVLALSIDSAGAAPVKRFYEELGIRSLAIYIDPTTRATATLAVVGVPTTLLIGRDGREIGRRSGPAEWDGPRAVGLFEDYVKKDRTP